MNIPEEVILKNPEVLEKIPFCGDGVCEWGLESDGIMNPKLKEFLCMEECFPEFPHEKACGDGKCVPILESLKGGLFYCEEDCEKCGNGKCDFLEDIPNMPKACPEDCPDMFGPECGNNKCEPLEDIFAKGPAYCPNDCGIECGDGECHLSEVEPGNTCAEDCAPLCGNKKCDPFEALPGPLKCAKDCPKCGDDVCNSAEKPFGTSPCPKDCVNLPWN